jgi:hypothetical protein
MVQPGQDRNGDDDTGGGLSRNIAVKISSREAKMRI